MEKMPVRHVYTISQLNQETRAILEKTFPLIWVEGEISNLSQPSSGHLYFSLKDPQAQIRCVMFNARHRGIGFKLENGLHVLVHAKVSLYEGSGTFQLIVDYMEEVGDGILRRAFEELKLKLAKEGLFDAAQKKPFPEIPKCIGVITSPTGAAIRDIISVLKRRAPSIPVIVYPTLVQGREAAPQIVRTLQMAELRQECDVLIVARGGGSLEDLFAFNEEIVARAIHAAKIPIVTGIGHEVDFTIADFVADQRAPTPSAAAELISPNIVEWNQLLIKHFQRLRHAIENALKQGTQHLFWLSKRLRHPGQRLQEYAQRLDTLEIRLKHALFHSLQQRASVVESAQAKLMRFNPVHRVQLFASQVAHLEQKLGSLIQHHLQQQHQRFEYLCRALDAASPLATLQRGYAVVTTQAGKVVTQATAVQPGEQIRTRLAEGQLLCRVEEVL